MHALIAVQVAFCFLVLFVARDCSSPPLNGCRTSRAGFSAEGVLLLDTTTARAQPGFRVETK